jgi:hypothetical protein
VTARVRLADVAPTVTRGRRAAGAGGDAGPFAAALVSGQAATDRPAYAETDYPRYAFGWSALASWRNDRFLLIKAPQPELTT